MSNIRQWKSLTQNLRKVLDDLPSSAERAETVKAINELVSALEKLGNALGAMPSAEEAARAKESLTKLENIVIRNPLMRGASNGKSEKPRPRAANGSKPTKPAQVFPTEVIGQTLASLKGMTADAMRSELEDAKRYSNDYLKALLSGLGRRVSGKGVKGEMIEQLVATIVNDRTLEGISNRRRL